jgi:hypothetical protein
MPQVVLSVPPDPAFVRVVRLVATAMARKSGIDEDVLDDVRLAVGQACARAVSAHRDRGLSDPVSITFADDASVEVAVHDVVALEPAEGEQAAALLSASTGQPADDIDIAGSPLLAIAEIALLSALAGDLEVTTGPAGRSYGCVGPALPAEPAS